MSTVAVCTSQELSMSHGVMGFQKSEDHVKMCVDTFFFMEYTSFSLGVQREL